MGQLIMTDAEWIMTVEKELERRIRKRQTLMDYVDSG